MTRPTANLRLFVAAYPPPAVVEAMLAAAGRIELPAHRPVPATQVHLTLLFIGDRPTAQMDETIESVRRSAAGLEPFALRPEALIALPERGPRRLVAAQLDAPATLLEVQRRLARRLARPPRSGRERPWLPHCTLLRFRSPWRTRDGFDEPLEGIDPFPVESIRLMRSTLHPDGARHEVVAEVALAG